MSSTTPLVVDHDAAWFRDHVATLLAQNTGWKPADTKGNPDQASAALIGVFARFCEIVVQRLNQVPDKNLLAFLDLLGTSLLPPQPARVPLTFTLDADSPIDAVVPAGTQVAAPAGAGAKDPAIFETERELTVVAATLQALFSADGAPDLIADHSGLLASPSNAAAAVFSADRPNEHLLYFGHPYLGLDNLQQLQLDIKGSQPEIPSVLNLFGPSQLIWEAWDGTSWQGMKQGLLTLPNSVAGAYLFPRNAGVEPRAPQTIGGVTSSWIRVKPRAPISSSTVVPIQGFSSSAAMLPTYERVEASVVVGRTSTKPDVVFTNGQAVDTIRPFYPFGERPKLGDALYIGSREAFGPQGASITLALRVLNPVDPDAAGASVPPTQASPDLELSWEAWNGTQWIVLGVSRPDDSSGGTEQFSDPTQALTLNLDPSVSLDLPTVDDDGGPLVPTQINGSTNYWIRVRISAGNYGIESHYVPKADAPGEVQLVPANFAPPLVESLSITYQATLPALPADVVTFNNLQFDNIGPALAQGLPVMPFRALPDQPPSLYMAFTVPPVRDSFPNRTISLYHGLKSPAFGQTVEPLHPRTSVQPVTAGTIPVSVEHLFTLTNISTEPTSYELSTLNGLWEYDLSLHEVTLEPGEFREVTVTVIVPPAVQIPAGTLSDFGRLLAASDGGVFSATFETSVGAIASRQRSVRWEYWNGSAWTTLTVIDSTDELTQSGVIEFLGPGDIALARYFGVSGYWVRALFEAGEDDEAPLLRSLLPNTTLAAQTVSVLNEVLGSSDATASQQFRTARAPVLVSQQLEVREPAPLTNEELAALQAAHGESGVVPASLNDASEVWVRWIEVPDLYGSGPADRHYVLDHVTGQITFGDGAQGHIPPRGVGNIRMARYQTGGGSAGNVGAGTIVQLKTTVPYIDKVSNSEAASGGVGAESNAELLERAPRALRHGGRAVAAEDYEDLARLASPEVARAKCVPLFLLQTHPLATQPVKGGVSVIILPDSTDPRPQPSVQLVSRVKDFLLARQGATAEVEVVGPLYVRVVVTVEAALTRLEGAAQVEQAIRLALAAFLHPLTGGRGGAGWDFGRQPHVSDLYAVIGGVPGVDHIRKLSLTIEDIAGALATGRFLIYSGQHQIKLTFIGAQ